jgi:hypothetical protein
MMILFFFVYLSSAHIYWFGDSYSDTGNVAYRNASLVRDYDSKLGLGITVHLRMSPTHEAGAVQNTVDHVARALKLQLVNAFTLTTLPQSYSLINYALIGATLDNNLLLLKPHFEPDLHLQLQLDQYSSQFDETDNNSRYVFFNIGEGDVALLAFDLVSVPPPYIDEFVHNFTLNYVTEALKLISKVYKRGPVYFIYSDLTNRVLAPAFDKADRRISGVVKLVRDILNDMQIALIVQIEKLYPATTLISYSELIYQATYKQQFHQPQNESQAENHWPDLQPAPDAGTEDYFYGDDLHPSERTAGYIAKYLLTYFA